MDDVKRIMVVSRSTKYCRKAVHYGISLARRYGAELYVLHVIHNPFGLEGWIKPIPSLKAVEEEYNTIQQKVRSELDSLIESEKARGLPIHILIRDGKPNEGVFELVEENKIDLLIMLAHKEGRLEHFLFGRSNEEIIRELPCSVMLVKQEPKPAAY